MSHGPNGSWPLLCSAVVVVGLYRGIWKKMSKRPRRCGRWPGHPVVCSVWIEVILRKCLRGSRRCCVGGFVLTVQEMSGGLGPSCTVRLVVGSHSELF